MGTWRWVLVVCIGILLLVGCSNGIIETSAEVRSEGETNLQPVDQVILDPKIEKEQSKLNSGLFQTSLETVMEDGKATFNFTLHNSSGDNLQIFHGSGQRYDIVVVNEQEEEVYRWSHDKAFTMALIERKLKKDESLVFTEAWNLEDNNGETVPRGIYHVEVQIMLGLQTENGAAISPDELRASSVVEVYSVK